MREGGRCVCVWGGGVRVCEGERVCVGERGGERMCVLGGRKWREERREGDYIYEYYITDIKY